MPEADQLVTKRRSRRFKLLVIVGPIAALILGLYIFDELGQRQLDRALAEAQAIGPVTLEEIEAARRTWPDDQNGALILEAIKSRLIEIETSPGIKTLPVLGEVELPPLGQLWDDETAASVARQLADMRHELAEIDRLRDYAGGRFGFPISSNPMETFSLERGFVRTALRIKQLETLERAMRGEAGDIVHDAEVMLRLGQFLADEPPILSAMIRGGCDQSVIRVVERVCNLTGLGRLELLALEAQCAAMDSDDRLYWGMVGERALFLELFDYLRSVNASEGSVIGRMYAMKAPGFRGWMLRDQAAGLRLCNARILITARHSDARIAACRQLATSLAQVPSLYLVTHVVVDPLERTFTLDMSCTASIRAARVALAVERYRLDTGRFPESLAMLLPAYLETIPVDPFNGGPLRYCLADDAAIVYSVGEDLADDGGEVAHRTEQKNPPDVGFVLLRPEHRGRPASQPSTSTGTAPGGGMSMASPGLWCVAGSVAAR